MKYLNNIQRWGDRISRVILRGIRSNYFFYAILTIVILQAMWYAFSFRPVINDESKHFGKVLIYAQHLAPFLGDQKPEWDHLGVVSRDGSFMFYYIMSWPLRIIQLFTNSFMQQVIALRLVCTGFVVAGLMLYRRALLEIQLLPKSVLHVLFLLIAITPSFALLAGAINYDNLAFLFFAYLLLLTVHINKSKRLNLINLLLFFTAAILISMIKWTSFVLVLPLFVFVIVDLWKKHGVRLFEVTTTAVRQAANYKLLIIGSCFVLSLILFVERPVMNLISYGKPNPECLEVLGAARCESYPDYVAYAKTEQAKPTGFQPVNISQFFTGLWIPIMASTMSDQLERGSPQPTHIAAVYKMAALLCGLFALLCFRELTQKRMNILLVLIICVYLGILVLTEYGAYIKYGGPAAIRARYLIPVMPLILYIAAQSIIIMYGKYRKTLLISSIGLVILMSQGASIVTLSLTAPRGMYWSPPAGHSLNEMIRKLFSVTTVD